MIVVKPNVKILRKLGFVELYIYKRDRDLSLFSSIWRMCVLIASWKKDYAIIFLTELPCSISVEWLLNDLVVRLSNTHLSKLGFGILQPNWHYHTRLVVARNFQDVLRVGWLTQNLVGVAIKSETQSQWSLITQLQFRLKEILFSVWGPATAWLTFL